MGAKPPRDLSTTLHLTEPVKDALREEALCMHISMSALMFVIIRAYLKNAGYKVDEPPVDNPQEPKLPFEGES